MPRADEETIAQISSTLTQSPGNAINKKARGSTRPLSQQQTSTPVARLFSIVSQAVENRRLLILQPFMMIAGILLYTATVYEPIPVILVILSLVLPIALYLWRTSATIMPLLFLLSGIWVGFNLLPIHGKMFGTEMLYGSFFGQFSARVDAIHSNDSDRARIIISEITSLEGRSSPPVKRARILLPAEQVPKVGDMIAAPMRLYRVPGPVVPGGFDSQFHAYFDGIGAFGSATGPVVITQTEQGGNIFRFVQNLRDFIGQRIDATLAAPISGIARALIIGDQGQVDPDIRSDLAAAGLAHVLAISGLHLSLVAGGVFAAVRMALAGSYVLGQIINVKKTAALAGMAAALTYLVISGASVSAIRATLMLLLVFGAVLAGRKALTMRNVAFAAIFVIIVDPASIFRPSFQLSFAAVTALVGAYEGYQRGFSGPKNWFRKFVSAMGAIALTSMIAGAATALFAAYHFQQVAPFGMFGNMIAIPLVSLVVLPAALIAVLLMPLGIEPVFLKTMGWGIEKIITVAEHISSFGAGLVSAPILGPTALMIGVAGLGWFAFFHQRVRFFGLAFAALMLPVFGTLPAPDIMIADSTKAVAARLDKQLELISGRANSFAVRAWSETYMEVIESSERDAPCDAAGCYYIGKEFELALITTRDAFYEDCARADIVITRQKAPPSCRLSTQTIDTYDLRDKGVHWLKWTGDGFWIRPAISDVHRPWRSQFPR